MTFYLGIDVSSKTLDVAFFSPDFPALRCEQYANSAAGTQKLLDTLSALDVAHVVLVATGGYENLVLDLLAARYQTTRIASHRGTAFARGMGLYAKTDRIDATVLARLARSMDPQPYVPLKPAQRHLRGLVKGRDQLVQQRDDNRRRIRQCESEIARTALERVNRVLAEEIKALDTQLREAANAVDEQRAEQLLQVPGMGKIALATVLAFLPELGQRSNRQISALVGLAPYTKLKRPEGGASADHGRSTLRSSNPLHGRSGGHP